MEVISMLNKVKIFLSPRDVKEFVKVTGRCDFDIDIAASNNRYIVDAKSILGVLGLDLSRAVTLTYSGYNADLEKYIHSHAMAC